MIRLRSTFAVLALSLTACATVTQYQAAGDIRALLVAIRDSDKAAFDAHIDRPALKAQLRARLMAGALKQQDQTGVLGALIAGPLVDIAVDQLAQPELFLAVAESEGYSPDKPIPNAALLAPLIKPTGDDQVCVTSKPGGPCVLLFRKEEAVWRLVAFEGDPRSLRIGKKR